MYEVGAWRSSARASCSPASRGPGVSRSVSRSCVRCEHDVSKPECQSRRRTRQQQPGTGVISRFALPAGAATETGVGSQIRERRSGSARDLTPSRESTRTALLPSTPSQPGVARSLDIPSPRLHAVRGAEAAAEIERGRGRRNRTSDTAARGLRRGYCAGVARAPSMSSRVSPSSDPSAQTNRCRASAAVSS
jgi:hypothetical protein